MEYSRLNLLVIAISCLAVLALPIFVIGCGGNGDDDDDSMSGNVVAPDPNPIPETTPQPDPQPEPEPQLELALGVSFQEDILPILQASCAVQGCHADPNPRVGLNLETHAGFEKGSLGGPVFNPGDSKGSKVVQRIDGGGMPPGAPLAKDQIQLFKDWIDEGAKNN